MPIKCIQREFTSTCYIIQNQKVLLVYHNKFQKWSPPGGHVEPNETPQEAAIRECLEETGLEISLVSDERQVHVSETSKSLPRPYMCLLENIPPYKDTPAHQHIDFIFIAKVIGGTERFDKRESAALKWFTLEEVQNIPLNEMFDEVRDSIYTLLEPSQSHHLQLHHFVGLP